MAEDSEVEDNLNDPCETSDASTVREDGRNSKAETDQSDAGTNKNFCEDLNIERLTLDENDAQIATSKRKEEQQTAQGTETPLQKRDSGVASQRKGKVQRKLLLDANQSKTGTEKKNELLERKDGELLEDHQWKGKTPSFEEPMESTVYASKVYTVSCKSSTNKKKKVNLEEIYLKLPKFIEEMRGLSIRQELEHVLNSTLLNVFTEPYSPHVLEITQKHNQVPLKDEPSERKQEQNGNDNFTAFSLPQQNPLQPSKDSFWFLDCEYVLKMHLPDDSLQWFNIDDQQGKRIRKINTEKKDKRWIFIPSFRRAKIALLDWSEDKHDIVTQESTIRVLVVRPSEFEEYVSYCGHKFPVICLPNDEIGAGYPRYWIQKIALRLELQFIWMIDDSVECFNEYYPDQEPPEHQVGNEWRSNYTDYRRRQFGLVFERIERLVKTTKDKDGNLFIAAMSPKRFMGGTKIKYPFVCKPPRIAVFLNLAALKSKEVYYRPELQVLEDMIFGYECEKNGLKVFIDNRIHLHDHDWRNTGARSPSVKQKPT